MQTLIDKKIEYMRRVHAKLDDGKTIDVFLDLDNFHLPVWSETDRKFLVLKNLKDTDTLNQFFVGLSAIRQSSGKFTTCLKNNGKEIKNDDRTRGLKLHQIGITRFSQSSTTSLLARFAPESEVQEELKEQGLEGENDMPIEYLTKSRTNTEKMAH